MEIFAQDSPDYATLSKYLPEGVDLKSVDITVNESHGLVLEYTLDQPADSVRQLIQGQNGQPNWHAITDHSSFEMRQTSGIETGIGVEGEVGVVGESVGLGVEATVTRSSERVVYSSK